MSAMTLLVLRVAIGTAMQGTDLLLPAKLPMKMLLIYTSERSSAPTQMLALSGVQGGAAAIRVWGRNRAGQRNSTPKAKSFRRLKKPEKKSDSRGMSG